MYTKLSRIGLFASALLCGGLGFAGSADAFQKRISFCNRTTSDVHVAIGFDRSGTSETTSKGWTRVRGCSCRSVLNADLRATEIFLLAARSGLDNVLQGGRAPLCVHPTNAFNYIGENASQGRCNRAGGEWVIFKWYDTGANPNYTLNLRRSGQCNMMGDG